MHNRNDIHLSYQKDVIEYFIPFPISTSSLVEDQKIPFDKIIQMCYEQLGRVTNFFNYDFISHKMNQSTLIKGQPMNFGFAKMIEHQIFYIENLIHIIKVEKFKRSFKILKNVIAILSEKMPKKLGDEVLFLNESKLFSDIQKEPSECIALSYVCGILSQKITLLSPPISCTENAKLELISIITDLTKKIDQKTSYFPMSPLQTTFEKLIMSDVLPWSGRIQHLINSFEFESPDVFVDSLFDIVSDILNYLNIQNQFVDSGLTFLLYRFIFDEIYQKGLTNKYFVQEEKIVQRMRHIKNSDIQLPSQYCPSFDADEAPYFTFRNDEFFGKAVFAIECAHFFTNPLDIIATTVQAISFIEESASHYDTENTRMFPFEVTFTLFIAVVLSTSFCDLSGLAQFIDDYTPKSGLCPAFEFAKSTLLASLTYIISLIE